MPWGKDKYAARIEEEEMRDMVHSLLRVLARVASALELSALLQSGQLTGEELRQVGLKLKARVAAHD